MSFIHSNWFDPRADRQVVLCFNFFFFSVMFHWDDHNLSWLFPNATHFVLENEITTLYIQNLMDDIFSSLQNSIHSTALKDQTPPASKNDEEEELFAVGDITNAFGIPWAALQIPTRHLFDSFVDQANFLVNWLRFCSNTQTWKWVILVGMYMLLRSVGYLTQLPQNGSLRQNFSHYINSPATK